jgi:uncharacterized RDD family membrane protein YckC
VPDFYSILRAFGFADVPPEPCFPSHWGSPINFGLYNATNFDTVLFMLTAVATLLLSACALIFMITGRALKPLVFLCSLMFAYRASKLLGDSVDFILSTDKSIGSLLYVVPSLVMTAVASYVLLLFRRSWDEQPVSGKPFVAAPIVRFYGYVVDLVIIQTVVQNGVYSLELSSYQWVIGLMAYVLYYVIFESLFQATPGKLAMNTRVSTLNGNAPGVATIILRTLLRLIPFEPLSCLYNEGWHDELSKTKVIRRPWAGGLVTTG